MWRGTGPTVWRLSLGAGLHFTALDALKGAAEARRPDRRMTATDAFLVGGLSRAIAATALCPVTLVRHRIFESDDFDCDLARLHCGAVAGGLHLGCTFRAIEM